MNIQMDIWTETPFPVYLRYVYMNMTIQHQLCLRKSDKYSDYSNSVEW